SLMESVRVICETRPSALALEGGDRPDADLELIVAKALAKAPEERYSSVAALSEDLGRFLAGEAILARPPSTMYQLQKLVKRHRPAFAAAGAAVVLLVAFGVSMATLYSRSERNLARALRAETEARAEATKARQTKDFLVRTFKVADPERSRGREITAREILTSGAEEVRQDTDLDPATRAELLDTIGTVHRQLGQNPEALALHEEGREVLRKAFGADAPQLASSELSLAHDLDNLGRYDEAIDAARAGIARLEALPPDDRPEDLADLHVALANALTEVGRMDEAQTAYELALAEVRQTHGDRSVEAALVLDNFGGSIIRRDPQRAKACLAEALSIREEVLPPDHPLLGFSYSNLSNLQSRLGEREAAVENAEKAFAIWEKCYPPEHPKIAEGLGNLAATYAESGRLEEAIDPMERCLALQEKLYGPMNPLVGRGYNNLALLQLQLGHVEPAAKYAQRSLEVALASGDGESPAASFAYYRIGEVAFERERWAEAKTAFEKSLAIDEKTLGPESDDVAGTSETLAEVLRKLGDERGAEQYLARAKVIRDKQAAAAAAAEGAPEEGTGS
ncbi:MAG: tetratricopeptide repeat protein, partial [Gemmatimonadetes bacterium]|nr:tetratricopeptide repeat protein [Gemmatimonadota bacterium]